MSYSNVFTVTQEAGFGNNPNVDDETVTRHISAADSRIDSIISKHYVLPLESTPPLIEQISRYLSAGYLLLEEYGPEADGTGLDGNRKIEWAESQLKMIDTGMIIITDINGLELSTSSNVELNGWPNNSTGTDTTSAADKDDPPQFEIGMKF